MALRYICSSYVDTEDTILHAQASDSVRTRVTFISHISFSERISERRREIFESVDGHFCVNLHFKKIYHLEAFLGMQTS